MADGSVNQRLHGDTTKPDAGASGLTAACRVGFVFAAGFLIVMGVDVAGGSQIIGALGWSVAVGLFTLSLFTGLTTRAIVIWRNQLSVLETPPLSRNSSQKAVLRSGFREMFVYLIATLTGLASIAFSSAANGAIGGNELRLVAHDDLKPDPVHVACYVAFLIASFVPLVLSFYLQARYETRGRGQDIFRDDAVSPSTFIVSFGLIGSIIALAWAAGDKRFEISDNLGIVITGLVILVFLGIILYPHVARFWNRHEEARTEALENAKSANMLALTPARWVSRIDSTLVRLIAPLSGATQKGPAVPHLLLLAVIVPLSAMGYVLASPFGLIPIFAAMLIALALGRRWAWVEDDRETASRLQTTQGDDIHVGFDNDLKDEALLGYASLFVLVPLALNQLQGWTGSFNEIEGAGTGNTLLDWLRFFGAELAKAVPFVDWWEIYDVDIRTPYEPPAEGDPLAKHLTFAARAMVDLVIMAALFQAIAIWQRRRMQHKLYDSGHLNAFDPFTETDFFENGMQTPQSGGDPVPKRKFRDRIARHAEQRGKFQMTRTPYSERRLSELINSDNRDVRSGAAWMIETYRILAGEPHEQLAQLAQRWRSPEGNPLRAATNCAQTSADQLRHEKLEFERVLADLTRNKKMIETVGDQEIGYLMAMLEAVRGAPEFNFAHVLSLELIGSRETKLATLALARHVLRTDHYEAHPLWKRRMENAMGVPPQLLLGQQEMRWKVYDALGAIASNRYADPDASEWALELLDWMGLPPVSSGDPAGRPQGEGGDAAIKGRERAAQRADEARAGREQDHVL